MKYVVWTLLVWVPTILLAARVSDFTGGWAGAGLALTLGLPIWVVGVVLMLWSESRGHWSSR